MHQEPILESQLQEWFEQAALAHCITRHIENREALATEHARLHKDTRSEFKHMRGGITRANQICAMLDGEPSLLAANNCIAPAACNQMRPDLILCTDAANYILVELKTRGDTERQCVQELLAYSAAVKMQAPYVNDFVYVVVAKEWSVLLRFAVRSLILDGKFVLPLRWRSDENSSFKLNILLDLFDINLTQHYPPMYAMVPTTLAGSKQYPDPAQMLRNYFETTAHSLRSECERLQQSGFALVWRTGSLQTRDETWSLTLATVNQHWENSEDLPNDYSLAGTVDAGHFHRATARQYDKEYDATLALYGVDIPEGDRFFGQAAAHSSASKYYPQSSLSYDLMERVRLPEKEARLHAQGRNCCIEYANYNNLAQFIRYIEASQFVNSAKIWIMLPFGEVAEYMWTVFRQRPNTVDEFVELMRAFHTFKEQQRLP